MRPDLNALTLERVCGHFELPGTFASATPHGTGHINDTFAVRLSAGPSTPRIICQRINTKIFAQVDHLMENIQRVTTHAARPDGATDRRRREALVIIPTWEGRLYHRDESGGCWRCYRWIEGASSHEVVRHVDQARAAAAAFGAFQRSLADLPGPRLHVTIPGFHDTPGRYARFEQAVAADAHDRATQASDEITALRDRSALAGVLQELQAVGRIPERITHNDTKVSNVLLDNVTGQGVCVIDLDTVMPGHALHDFGDMVRTAANSAAEDAADLTSVEMRRPVFAALCEGYLESTRGFLNATEIEHLAVAARIITYEQALRFLTDFLQGDTYYKTGHPGHNLQRTRAQLALLRSMEAQTADMEQLVRRFN